MKIILVWVLVTVGGYSNTTPTYGPELVDLASCEHLQNNLPDNKRLSSRCIQIKVYK